MKILISSIILLFLFPDPRSFYDLSVRTIDGNVVNMNDYRNKKLMIVILSTNTGDSLNLQALDSISKQYTDSITMIGVPSFEEGASIDSVTSLQNYYRTYLGSQFIVSEMMYTTKTSGQQSELFAWLTSQDQNGHFDMDAEGPGSKYFINGNGELNGVFDPEVPLGNKLVSKMILN